jgi:hypothetical protein
MLLILFALFVTSCAETINIERVEGDYDFWAINTEVGEYILDRDFKLITPVDVKVNKVCIMMIIAKRKKNFSYQVPLPSEQIMNVWIIPLIKKYQTISQKYKIEIDPKLENEDISKMKSSIAALGERMRRMERRMQQMEDREIERGF